jgi:hypothetical protein
MHSGALADTYGCMHTCDQTLEAIDALRERPPCRDRRLAHRAGWAEQDPLARRGEKWEHRCGVGYRAVTAEEAHGAGEAEWEPSSGGRTAAAAGEERNEIA